MKSIFCSMIFNYNSNLLHNALWKILLYSEILTKNINKFFGCQFFREFSIFLKLPISRDRIICKEQCCSQCCSCKKLKTINPRKNGTKRQKLQNPQLFIRLNLRYRDYNTSIKGSFDLEPLKITYTGPLKRSICANDCSVLI